MSVRDRLRADLAVALKTRDAIEISTLRTLVGAIENAEAVEVKVTTGPTAEPNVGLGHDQPRRILTEEDLRQVIAAERADVAAAAAQYRELGLDDETTEMERRLEIVDRYLTRST